MTAELPILVVEDEDLLLAFLRTALDRGGVKSLGASSGAAAIESLEKHEFAAVVCDLRLPGGIGGGEIYDWVLEHRPNLAPCFLFITGNCSDSYAIQVRERTGALFIEKPFRIGLLIQLINQITQRGEQVHAG
jgi:DNA-binding NtrC family response regulator